MIEGRPNSPAVVAGPRTSSSSRRGGRGASRLPSSIRALRCVRVGQCQMSGSGETNQDSAPAARVLNTDAGAPPARGGMRQATRAAGADSGMRVCRIGPGADKDGTRCTGGRRGEARNIRE